MIRAVQGGSPDYYARPQSAGSASAEPRDRFDLSARLAATRDEADSLDEKLAEHIEGEVLVKLRPGLSTDALADFAERYGAKLIEKIDVPAELAEQFNGDLIHLALPEGMSTGQAIAVMQADPLVQYAAANEVLKALEERIPNDLDNRLWGMRKIDGPAAWGISTGQRENGPIVCVIDTGVDYTHPDLRNNMWRNPGEIPGNGKDDDGNGVVDDVFGYNAYRDNGDPMDDHAHGSHCAGSIGAEGDNGQGVVGVNWQTRIMAGKFLSNSGSGTTAGAIKAVMYASRMGARITSNSWGGGGFNQALYDALKASPALHIFAAGNESNDNDRNPAYPASYDLPNIISVAALDRSDRTASFTNWGATTVDIGAPGVDIFSTTTQGRYGNMSGTSMACPHVSGVATMVAALFPNASNAEIKDRILKGAIPVASLEGKAVTGGRLNLKNAIENDTVPPAAPGALAAGNVTYRQVALGWTAPGDDGLEGRASGYELRYSFTPITDEASFQNAALVATGRPGAPGAAEAASFDVTPSGAERPVYVALRAYDNAGNVSEMSKLEVRVPPARVAFEDNFDAGAEKWTAQGTWGRVEWPGRGQVWTDSPGGSYGNRKDMSLVSQTFSLKGMRNSTLFFDARYEIEARHDNLLVEVSKDGGRRWSEVARFSGNSDWSKQTVDLKAFDNQDVKVRFRMKTDRSITFDGFYLDNVAVAGEG